VSSPKRLIAKAAWRNVARPSFGVGRFQGVACHRDRRGKNLMQARGHVAARAGMMIVPQPSLQRGSDVSDRKARVRFGLIHHDLALNARDGRVGQQAVVKQLVQGLQVTSCRWRKECGGLKTGQVKRLKELEKDRASEAPLVRERLNGEIFYSLAEPKIVIETSRCHDNTKRPPSSPGYRPPAPQVIQWPATPSGAAPPATPAVASRPIMHQD
jgi:hypothetical protein